MSSADVPSSPQIEYSDPIVNGVIAEQPPGQHANPDEPGPDSGPTAPLQPIEYVGVIHLTRTWVQYGIFGFAVLCIVIGAVEGLFGR